MKKRSVMPLKPLIAAAIAVAAALIGFNALRGMNTKSAPLEPLVILGEIQALEGEVEHRLPSSQFERLAGPAPLHSQELILTHRASEATLQFKGGAVVRLHEGSRLVAEFDATQPGAIIATVLEGRASITNPGSAGSFRAFQNGTQLIPGQEFGIKIPVIPSAAAGANKGSPLAEDSVSAVVPTTPDEGANAARAIGGQTGSAQPAPTTSGHETLSNDEITRQLKSQTGFFQRCYLTFVNRLRTQIKDPGAQEAGPEGTITVSFAIRSNGKVSGQKVVRSQFTDATFHSCVLDVVSRTSFRPFNGDDVSVDEFPIAF